MAATENPFDSLHNAITSSAKVYALTSHDAWIYGIIVGWDDSDFVQLQEMHKWSDTTVARLKRLHEKYVKLTVAAAKDYVQTFIKGFGKETASVTALTKCQVTKAAKMNENVWIRKGSSIFCAKLSDIVTEPHDIAVLTIGEDTAASYSLKDYRPGSPLESPEDWTAYACPPPEGTP